MPSPPSRRLTGILSPSTAALSRTDVLLAVSRREAGATLVTRNEHDFDRIRRVMPFRFVQPWPVPPRAPRNTPLTS